MTREEAINEIKSWDFLNEKESEAVRTLIPELRESEDERIRQKLIHIVNKYRSMVLDGDDKTYDDCLAYLEVLKEPAPAEWSEEDKDYYDTIVRKLEVIGDDSGLSSNQIKFLREHCPLSRSEWNEEDETIIEGACSALEIHGHTKLASMLKSLRPQPH